MFHGDRYSGVSTYWHLVPYFSVLVRIQFSRLTVVLSVTGRYKVYASYACLDPGIQIIEFLLPLIQTLPPLEKEKAHEVRLDGFLPPTLLSATSLARCPWSGQLKDQASPGHVRNACVSSVRQFAGLLKVIMSSAFRFRYKKSSPTEDSTCKTTLKNPAWSIRLREGRQLLAPNDTKPNAQETIKSLHSLCKHSPKEWAILNEKQTRNPPSRLVTEV